MTKRTLITYERLREVLDYSPRTGVFRWKKKTCKKVVVGQAAGCNSKGYCVIRVDDILYAAHRLAWLYVTRKWPKNQIDHANCNPMDNRYCNLREATSTQNHYNSRLFKNNTSGFKGVSWHKGNGNWRASIFVNGRNIHLGSFDDADEAAEAYAAAATHYAKEFARW